MSTTAGITTIDCHYIYPRVAAAYLVVDGDEAAFVENNTVFAVPHLLRALGEQGRQGEDVRWIIITHVHLDHAGGTAELLENCPNATVLAHPRAARHIIDPTRLVKSARAVYGEEQFAKLYGEIVPIPAERVRTMDDGTDVELGSRRLSFFNTKGHANHHFCVFDEKASAVFTGDSFGIAYPDLQNGTRPVLYPSTTPTDFDAQEARLSVERILATGARSLYPTHFGEFTDLNEGREQMLSGLDKMEAIMLEARATDLTEADLQDFCERRVKAYFEEKMKASGLSLGPAEWEKLSLDVGINAMGLAFAAARGRS